MTIHFSDANIVFIASFQHNVGMISEHWLRANNLLLEQPIQTFNVPGMFIFNSISYRILVTDDRINIATNKENKDNFLTIANVIRKYIEENQKLPYKAIGFNFTYLVDIDEKSKKFKIEFNNRDNIETLLKADEVNYGGIIEINKDDYVIQIRINPEKNKKRIYNFNYHFPLEKPDNEFVLQSLDKLNNYYSESKVFVTQISD